MICKEYEAFFLPQHDLPANQLPSAPAPILPLCCTRRPSGGFSFESVSVDSNAKIDSSAVTQVKLILQRGSKNANLLTVKKNIDFQSSRCGSSEAQKNSIPGNCPEAASWTIAGQNHKKTCRITIKTPAIVRKLPPGQLPGEIIKKLEDFHQN